MERNIIVIDDFYDDPDEVRNFGLAAEYPDPGKNYTYPGKNSRLGFYNDDTHKKMESIVGAGLEPSSVSVSSFASSLSCCFITSSYIFCCGSTITLIDFG